MARGDYVKTTFVNGTAPPIDATYLNRLETKVSGMDLIQATQTPLNSGLICAPLASVPEWPDAVAGTTYFQNTWADVDGWSAVSNCTVSFNATTKRLIVTATGANPRITKTQTIESKSFRMKVYQTTGNASKGQIGNATGTVSATEYTFSNKKAIGDHYFPAGATAISIFPGTTGSANLDVYEIEFMYLGDGTYSSLALDGSGNGNHATVYGATPVDTVAGRGFSFNGLTNRLEIPNFVTPSIMNFSTIVNCTTLAAAGAIIDIGAITVAHFEIYRPNASDSIIISYWNGAARVTLDFTSYFTGFNSASVRLDISVNWTTGAYTLYRNGASFSLGTLTTPSKPATGTLIIGNYIAGIVGFVGTIADPRIYNRALTAEEVWELYAKPGMARMSGPVIASVSGTPHSLVARDANGYHNTLKMASGAGIDFSANTSASEMTSEVLDDYEEGTWTPAIAFGGASVGITYNVVGGKYTKIGDRVFFTGLVALSAKGSSTGTATISGLPFTAANATGNTAAVTLGGVSAVTFADVLSARVQLSSAIIDLYETTNAGVRAVLTDADFAATSSIAFSGHYYV